MSPEGQRACVIGAGFGGLALAIRLQAAGVATTLIEAHAALRDLKLAGLALGEASRRRDHIEAAVRAEEQALALHVHVVETRGAARAQRAASLAEILGATWDVSSPRAVLVELGPRIEELRTQQHTLAAARATLAESEPRLRSLEEEVATARARAHDDTHDQCPSRCFHAVQAIGSGERVQASTSRVRSV